MIFRKKAAAVIAAAMMFSALSSCKTVSRVNVSESSDETSQSDNSNESPTSAESSEPVESYPEYPITYPEIEHQDTGDLYEAENCILNTLSVSDERTNFSGSGYVTGFSADGTTAIEFPIEVPSNQHYDLTFCVASDEAAECRVNLNDAEISVFETTNDGAFTKITIYGVFLVKGESSIEFLTENSSVGLDYMRLSNSSTPGEITYDANGELTNENADESAKELMTFLSENYGKYLITGQYVSDETNSELDLVYRTTGKYPVIRFAALENTESSAETSYKTIDAAADWHKNGGIVGLMWHWESPGDKPSVYSEETDFKLSDAVTDIDIATLSQEEIRGLYGEGKITEQCYGLILDIDNMADQLLSLRNKGIPVLWRPLHEGSGDWFWWGASGSDNYKWLWELMYTRMTEYFELDNLIWIWNGQSADTLVDKETFDIAAVDIYLGSDKDYGSRYEQFAALQKLVGGDKLIALSECSSVPDADASFRDNAVWSFFGLWYGKYLQNSEGDFSEEFCSKENFIRTYNSSGVITLDEYKAMKDGTYVEPTTVTPTEADTTVTEEE